MEKRSARKRRIVTPRLKPQIEVASQDNAGEKRFIAGENTSRVYSLVYKAMEGGRVAPLTNGYTGIIFPWEEVRFLRPDIIHRRKSGMGYTEVKAVSTRTSQPHCSTTQFENYAFCLLHRLEQGDKIPWVDYALFRYGSWRLIGQHKLSNADLITTLAENTRDLAIVPFNLMTFLLMNSPIRTRDQSSSGSTVDERSYWDIRSSALNVLHREDPQEAIKTMMNSNEVVNGGREEKKRVIEELCLDRLEVKRFDSPEIHLSTGVKIKPFEVTKYRVPAQDYEHWLNNFRAKHGAILERLEVRDLYAELESHGGSARFGKMASYAPEEKVPF